MKKLHYLVFIFIISTLLIACDTERKRRPLKLKKVQPVTEYYKLKEKPKGGDFYDFIYMYPISKKNLKSNPDYYQVNYDDYGRIAQSITYSNKKPLAKTVFTYRPDHQVSRIEEYYYGKLNSYIEIKYKDGYEKELINFSPDNKILRKRISEYDDGLLEMRIVLAQDKKILEMKYEYTDKDLLKKINIYRKGLLNGVEHYDKHGRLIREEIIPDRRIEYFYFNSGLLQKEKIYRSEELSQSISYDYNQRGDRVQIEIYDRNSMPAGKWLYLSDDGRLQKVEIYRAGQLALTKKMIYSEDGYLYREENWRPDELRSYYIYTYDRDTSYLTKWVKYNPKNEAIRREEYIYNDKHILIEKNHYLGDKLANKSTLVKGKWKKEVFIEEKDSPNEIPDRGSHLEEQPSQGNEYKSGLDG